VKDNFRKNWFAIIALPAGLYGLLFAMFAIGTTGCRQNDGESGSGYADTSAIGKKIAGLTAKLADDPRNADLFRERAELYYEDKRTAEAVADIDSALILDPANPGLWYLRGFFEQRLNNDSLALIFYLRSVDLGSKNPETYFEIGKIFQFKYRDDRAALQWMDKAISLDSLQPVYYFAKGMLHYLHHRMDTAIALFGKSLAIDPGFVKALDMMFEVYLNEYRDEKTALAYNSKILDVDSLHPKARFNQGVIFSNMASRITEPSEMVKYQVYMKMAIAEFTVALTSDQNFAKAFYNRGYCYYMLDRYEESLSDYDQVLRLDPYNEKAFFMRGAILEKFGDREGAEENYEKAIQIDPEFGEALTALDEVKGKGKMEK